MFIMKSNKFMFGWLKAGVVLFLLTFVGMTQAMAQNYVSVPEAKIRLANQITEWELQIKGTPNSPNNADLELRVVIFQNMTALLNNGQTVANAVQVGVQRYSYGKTRVLSTVATGPTKAQSSGVTAQVTQFQSFTVGLLSN
jgi:hypothetical protein